MNSAELAIKGGPKIASEPFPPWPWYTEEIVQAASEPLRQGKTNYWTGPRGMQFEQKFAEWVGCKYGISTNTGTSAIHVALSGGLNIGPGDEVIVPSYTFIGTSFPVCQSLAVPVFADVEPNSHTISPDSIRENITERTRAIIPVHLYGCMCEMDEIMEIARENDLYVVEDAAQAHGGVYKGKKAGSIGDIGCFSFCQSKTFSTGGEGGCVVTDNEEWTWRMRSFRDHGYDVEKRMSLLELEAALPYIHNMVGYNYRMTEMGSAIGLKELERIDNWNLPNRRRNAGILNEALGELPQILALPPNSQEIQNAYWLYPIVLDMKQLDCNIKQFTEALAAEGIPSGPVQWPQGYKEKAYREHNGFGRLRYPFESPDTRPEAVEYDQTFCPNAADMETKCFWVPVHPTYEPEHIKLIAAGIKKVIAAYAK